MRSNYLLWRQIVSPCSNCPARMERSIKILPYSAMMNGSGSGAKSYSSTIGKSKREILWGYHERTFRAVLPETGGNIAHTWCGSGKHSVYWNRSVFIYPDILQEPAKEILRQFMANQTAIIFWFSILAIGAAC